MSSRSPGCSPISISRAFATPSPITAWVVPCQSSQARHFCAVSRSLARLGLAGTGAAGASGSRAARGIGSRHGYPRDEARTHRLLGLELRRLAREPSTRSERLAAAGSSCMPSTSTPSRSTRPSTACRAATPSRPGCSRRPGVHLRRQGQPLPHPHQAAAATSTEGIAALLRTDRAAARTGRLGPVLWQLPANFHRDDERLARLARRRCQTAGTRSSSATRAGLCAPVMQALRDARRGADDRRPSPAAVPVPRGHRRWRFVRFHYGSRGRAGNYSATELETWARRIAQWRRREPRSSRTSTTTGAASLRPTRWPCPGPAMRLSRQRRQLGTIDRDPETLAATGRRRCPRGSSCSSLGMGEDHDPVGLEGPQGIFDRFQRVALAGIGAGRDAFVPRASRCSRDAPLVPCRSPRRRRRTRSVGRSCAGPVRRPSPRRRRDRCPPAAPPGADRRRPARRSGRAASSATPSYPAAAPT